jgi:hypothetical protein
MLDNGPYDNHAMTTLQPTPAQNTTLDALFPDGGDIQAIPWHGQLAVRGPSEQHWTFIAADGTITSGRKPPPTKSNANNLRE